jgi:hypothetical protein
MEFWGLKIKIPIIVRVDNVGAIYMSNNSSTFRTKHVDVCYHFVQEFVEDGIVKIIFVKSAENKADIFTKNVQEELMKKHVQGYMVKG